MIRTVLRATALTMVHHPRGSSSDRAVDSTPNSRWSRFSGSAMSYVIGAVQVEHFGPLSGPGTEALADLPSTRAPTSPTARHARTIPPAEELQHGLRLVFRGLGAL
jgi:hypothetical protein